MSLRRKIVRRAQRAKCSAVGVDGFRLLGDKILDISPYGLLVAADQEVFVGEEVIISFELGGKWFDADGEVTRVIEGWRDGDPGYAFGLAFTNISLCDRIDLSERLRGVPPPVPQRAIRAS